MTRVVRLAEGGEIDRHKVLEFSFDGMPLQGFKGDTVASALLANDILVLARSFKYHRPRGILAAGAEEPNAILDLRSGLRHDPNARATIEPLQDGMALRSVHAQGNAAHDRLGFLDRLHRFIPAGFYYKTFLWPGWRFYERGIRRLAGLGRLDPQARASGSPHRYLNVELCVIGAGPAGLAAALAGVRRGHNTLLIDEQSQIGGSLLFRDAVIDGKPGSIWVAETENALRAGGATILARTTAFGLYDGNEIVAIERGSADSSHGERIWRIHAKNIVLAAGAIERPMLFENNDRPGILLSGAGLSYLRRHGLRLGQRVVVATANDSAYQLAHALATSGSLVTILDARSESAASAATKRQGIETRTSTTIARVLGDPIVQAVRLSDGSAIEADFVFVSDGWTPTIHLYCQARGKPRWVPEIGAFVPGDPVAGLTSAGAINGAFDLGMALAQGWRAGGGERASAPVAEIAAMQWTSPPRMPAASQQGRIWVDHQSDVTVRDIRLAARENFASVEHLKRYTTLGMATDQGKTSNLNGLAALAEATGRDMSALGLTTYRPPYAPVSMAAIVGTYRGEHYAPMRRLPAENDHRADGARFREYGGILRPSWYGSSAEAIAAECRAARTAAIAFDGSSLGKIEVLGPDAAALLDFVFYTRMSTLQPGRLRYGLMLTEGGVVFDDGVVSRLAPDGFVVSCSSSHVGAVVQHLEEWRQDRFDRRRVFVHDATAHWATIAIAGPHSRSILDALDLGLSAAELGMPHMAMCMARFHGRPARIARVSFIGERSYEISVPAGLASNLWQEARAAGALPIGVEALSVLRAEKGYIIVGQDTDGETMPHDIGMDGPRKNRRDPYVGDRSLLVPIASGLGRRQLVGIECESQVLPAGAHAIEISGSGRRSLGYVTSGYFSPTLKKPIALGLIEDGRRQIGRSLSFEHLGKGFVARLVEPCFLDPKGERLNA